MSASLSRATGDRFAALHAASLSHRPAPAEFGLRGAAPVLHFSADNEIYAEGDAAVSFYKVATGVVRTCKFSSDGRRQIDAFYVAGDMFGLEAGAEYSLSAEAVGECTLVPYRRRGLEHLAEQDRTIALDLFALAMGCFDRAREHALLLGRASAAQKLAAFLLEMTARAPGAEFIELPMSRQDIADYLGLTIETVSRTLSQMERDGMITLSSARRIRIKNRGMLKNLNA